MFGYGKCQTCGRVFTRKHPTAQVRCPECQEKHRKEQQNEYKRICREKKRKKKDPHECGRKKTCIYGITAGCEKVCDYMGKTGRKRPCPVQGCTEYKRKTKKKGAEESPKE